MKSTLGKLALLALVTAMSGGAVVSCAVDHDKGGDEKIQGVSLNLEVAPGVIINSVNATVTGNGITPITQAINTSDPGATPSIFVGGLPAGGPYTVNMSGTSTDNATSCTGSATFSVVAGQTTSVSVALQCVGPDNRGAGNINGTVNSCPQLTSWIAAPTRSSCNGLIAVSATASDLNASNALSFTWSSTSGSFVAPNSASTSFDCSTAGATTLTVTVSDGTCTDSATIPVTCVDPGCAGGQAGNGGGGAGGAPVAGAGGAPVAGAGGAPVAGAGGAPVAGAGGAPVAGAGGAPVAGAGGAPVAGAGGAPVAGAGGAPVAGAGGVSGGGVSGGGAGGAPPALCGNGTTETGEVCDPGFTAENCGADCGLITSAACRTCEDGTECAQVTDCSIAAGTAPNGVPRARLCNEALDCVRDSGCASALELNCYCGTATQAQCDNGGGNGVCRAAIERALETTVPAEIFNRFTDPTFGGGVAMLRVGCDNAFCEAACGL